MKEEKQLQKDLDEAEAETRKEQKEKLVGSKFRLLFLIFPQTNKTKQTKKHTQTLEIVFQIYFRVLKNMRASLVLEAVLRGLGK